jgi:hypothetical protein
MSDADAPAAPTEQQADAHPAEQGQEPPRKGKGGAPRGNQNAVSSGLHRATKRTRPRHGEDRHDVAGRTTASELYGPKDVRWHLWAKRHAAWLRLGEVLRRRGATNKAGREKDRLPTWDKLGDSLEAMYRERHAELRAEAERRGMGAAGPVLHRVRIVTDYDLDDFGRCPGCQRQVERTLRVPGSVFGAPNREIPMGGPFVPDPLSPDEAKAWNEYTAKLEHEQSTRAVAHARAEAAERPAAVRAPRPAANEAADVEPACARCRRFCAA